MMTSADVIAARLYEAGVRNAFGIPGGEVLALIDALERNGIRFTVARHENAAGFMAEGVYHATGAPGVLVATVGPGIANAVNVVANAEQDRVPLIVFSGKVAEADTLTYTHQIFDHQAIMRPLCKASFEARVDACDVMIEKALTLATAPRPGPVHVDLPIPVARAAHRAPLAARHSRPAAAAPAGGPALDRARAMFAAARRPLMMVGLDVLTEPGASDAIRAVSREHGIPVVTTYKAKGVVPESEPLSLGGHGLSPKSDGVILPLVAKADLVIAAGYDPIEMRAGWRDPWLAEHAIAISAASNDHFVHHEAIAWTCGIAAGLTALTRCLEPAAAWPQGEIAAVRSAGEAAFAPTGEWGPREALHVLDRLKPADCVTTVDSGAHRILLSQIWTCDRPGALVQSSGLCTMGCALPLANGRSLADPARPVVAVMGDGCLDMTLGELATLRDLDLRVVVVVFVDASYALIELKQRAEGLQSAGVEFGKTDYAAIARGFGIQGHTVASAGELERAFTQALAHPGPSLIAVDIPKRSYEGEI